MKKPLILAYLLISIICAQAEERRISAQEYEIKMAAGWIGQMVGCTVGYPAEFKFNGTIVPPERFADRLDMFGQFNSPMINKSYGQDDLYVEITFLETLKNYGLDVSPRQAGIDFASSKYPLWCANDAGRKNLRNGIAPPDSGHPANTKRCNDIDYQIECDFAGLISPGLPQRVIKLSHVFGSMMNYGDGVWAGQFVGAMYAEAFFTTDRRQIVRAGLKAIPMQSQYAGMVYDTLYRYEKFMIEGGGKAPKDAWKTAHAEAVKKFDKGGILKDSNGNIDVRLNGAMFLIGFLYGEGDIARTIEIAARCGYDSDCNPATAAGILFTTIGLNKIPAMWHAALARNVTFWSTDYTFQKLVATSRDLAQKVVLAEGGRIEKDAFGKTFFVIPVVDPVPDPYQPSWDPAPATGVRFTPEEMAKIAASQEKEVKK